MTLKELISAIGKLLTTEAINQTVTDLQAKLKKSDEPYVWKVLETEPLGIKLPGNIKSAWIFALKKDTPSILHYHPNSTQHTVIIKGGGRIKIGESLEELRLFDSTRATCYVIEKNVPHEFYPAGEDIVVISFHTCSSDELVEKRCDDGGERRYENKGSQAYRRQ